MTVAVVAARGGERLARALASVGWAAERLVVDPSGRVPAGMLPAGTRRLDTIEIESALRTAWVLLLAEDESADAALAGAVAARTRAPAGGGACRVVLTMEGFAARWRLRGAPLRLAPREGVRLALARDGRVELRSPAVPAGTLDGGLLVHAAPSLAAMVDDMTADGATAATVLAAQQGHACLGRLLLAACVAGGRTLCARRLRGIGGEWPAERWCLALVAAYRAVLVHAQLWERTALAVRPS